MQATSVYEFDDHFTAPMANYDGVDDYYARTSVHHRLHQIGIPSLIIQSSNDPWIPTAPALAQPAGAWMSHSMVLKANHKEYVLVYS